MITYCNLLPWKSVCSIFNEAVVVCIRQICLEQGLSVPSKLRRFKQHLWGIQEGPHHQHLQHALRVSPHTPSCNASHEMGYKLPDRNTFGCAFLWVITLYSHNECSW